MSEVFARALPFWIASIAVFAVVFAALLAVGIRFGGKKEPEKRQERGTVLIYAAFVLFLAFFTRFLGFNYPFNTFWDENYHVASAQKYIGGVFFMEPHPPLGKMLIAAGERIVNPNAGIDTSPFLTTDYIRDFPNGYSFLGVRFLPTLLSTLSCVLFFLFLNVLMKNPHYAFLFSFVYIFENASVLHTRSAMLEGPQFFFMLLSLLYFAVLSGRDRAARPRQYLVLGVLTGLAVSVKLNALILALQFIILAWKDHGDEIRALGLPVLRTAGPAALLPQARIAGRLLLKAAGAVTGIAGVFFLSYYLHFAIASSVAAGRTYRASPETVQIMNRSGAANPLNFPVQFRDHLAFISHYERGVPKWDPTKADENGSPAFGWPFGYKSINYRWEKGTGRVAYFTLQGNPVVWYASLLAVFLAVALILSRSVFGLPVTDRPRHRAIVLLTAMYLGYLFIMLGITRVMYLNHYLMPLVFAAALLALVFQDLFDRLAASNDRVLYYAAALFALQIFAVYLFFSPLTYGIPLSVSEFTRRVWLPFWDLRAVGY